MNQPQQTRFDLLRHGKVDGPPALYGRTDICLSEEGHSQMYQQSEGLLNVDNIVSSPLRRCREFAEELAKERELNMQTEIDLQECDFGVWDGIEFDDQSQHWPLMTSFWHAPDQHTPPQGESLQDFHHRVNSCWHLLCEKYALQNNLLVCHGGVIRQILASILPVDWRQGTWHGQLQIGYASLTRITIPHFKGAKPVVNFIGLPHDVGHESVG